MRILNFQNILTFLTQDLTVIRQQVSWTYYSTVHTLYLPRTVEFGSSLSNERLIGSPTLSGILIVVITILLLLFLLLLYHQLFTLTSPPPKSMDHRLTRSLLVVLFLHRPPLSTRLKSFSQKLLCDTSRKNRSRHPIPSGLSSSVTRFVPTSSRIPVSVCRTLERQVHTSIKILRFPLHFTNNLQRS